MSRAAEMPLPETSPIAMPRREDGCGATVTRAVERNEVVVIAANSQGGTAMPGDLHPTNGWGYLGKQAPLYFAGDFHFAVGALADDGLSGQRGKEPAVLDGEAGLSCDGAKQRQVAARIRSFAALRSQCYDADKILTAR